MTVQQLQKRSSSQNLWTGEIPISERQQKNGHGSKVQKFKRKAARNAAANAANRAKQKRLETRMVQVSKDPANEAVEKAQDKPNPPLQAEKECHEGVESRDKTQIKGMDGFSSRQRGRSPAEAGGPCSLQFVVGRLAEDRERAGEGFLLIVEGSTGSFKDSYLAVQELGH